MKKVLGRGAVNQCDRTPRATVFQPVNHAHALSPKSAVMNSAQPNVEVTLTLGRHKRSEDLCVSIRRLSKETTRRAQHFVDVFGRENQFALVHGYVSLWIVSILHRAEQRVGAPAQHDVEGWLAPIPLMRDRNDREVRSAQQFRKQDSGD